MGKKGDRQMNLTELQMQLRSVEEQMAELQTEIEKMKPKPESEKKLIYNKITKLAQKYPIENKRSFNISEVVAKAYVSCLAHIIVADEDKIYDKLLYLTRIAYGMGLSASADAIILMGMDFDKNDFDNACIELKDIKYAFLTDALILVNINEQASEDAFALIADMAQALGCDKEDVRAAGFVAKAVLKNDFDILNQMPAPSNNRWAAQLRSYIPDSWIEAKRIKCGSFRDRFSKSTNSLILKIKILLKCFIKEKIGPGTLINKYDHLIVFQEKLIHKDDESFICIGERNTHITDFLDKDQIIKAPCGGVVFYIEDKIYDSDFNGNVSNWTVYVVSYFDDYESLYKWHTNRLRGGM